MTSRGTRLRIEVRFGDSSGSATFVPADGPATEVGLRMDQEELVAEVARLREVLNAWAHELGDQLETPGGRRFMKGLRNLNDHGLRMAFRLFGDDLPAVVGQFRKACPLWQSPQPGPPPTIEMAASSRGLLPIEFMPLLHTWPPAQEDAITLARRFVGFSCFVRRCIERTPLTQDRILDDGGRLPVKLFHHAGLPGIAGEAEVFRSRSQVDLQGPWPDRRIDEARFGQDLAGYLIDPRLGLNGDRSDAIDQIQHFACHCGSDSGAAENDYLQLAHQRRFPRRVTIKDLETSRAYHLLNTGQDRPPLPLIFVNACKSAVENSRQVSSFRNFFVAQNHNRGFIGTEACVPGEVAAAFSSCFYAKLLSGMPLGRSIHESRWHLLHEHGNPMGVLYTVHADPDIRIAGSAPEPERMAISADTSLADPQLVLAGS